MSPAQVETHKSVDIATNHIEKLNIGAKSKDNIVTVSEKEYALSNHKEFLPTWDHSEKYPPLKFHEHHDRGIFADPSFSNLLPKGTAKVSEITPKLGSEISNVQLSQLSDAGKDELALFVAQRGVAIFRDQDFASKSPKFVVDYAKHFGELHIHPFAGAAKGFPELLIVYRGPDGKELTSKNSYVNWHTDTSFELQPPGTTFLTLVDSPPTGGDTLFSDTVEAYNRLSPTFQKSLEGLKVLHTSKDLPFISVVNGGGTERRAPVTSIHPLVRIHPVTKQKSIYVNRTFTRSIVGLKEEESRALLEFLFKVIEASSDLQLRAKWEPNTVVVWDNRRVVHAATLDFDPALPRHGFRLTPHAERPVENLDDLNREDYLAEYEF